MRENNNKPSILSRREFLDKVGSTVTTTALVNAFSVLGITLSVSSCGSSSASTPTSIPNPNVPIPTPTPQPETSPRPIDWPNAIGNGKEVIILGAGIAGMTAAFEMEKLGYNCTILEATSRAGGRNRTIRSGDISLEVDSTQTCFFDNDPDLYFNPGPARIPHHHDLLLGYCRQFSVELEPFINQNQAALMHSSVDFNGLPILSRQVNADSQGYIGELLATLINQGSLDNLLTGTDKTNLLGLVTNFADLDSNFSYQSSTRSGFPGQELGDSRERDMRVSALPRDQLLASEFWQFKLDFFKSINQQATMLQPVGGMDLIASAFANEVNEQIIFEAVVSAIEKTSSGVNIKYSDISGAEISLSADYCICTIPAPVLKDINNDFSVSHLAAITNFKYSKAGKLAFQSRRFWEQDNQIYGGISWTDQDITQLWYPSNKPGSDQGIILGAYTFGDTQGNRFSALSPQQRINTGITEANALHSEYANEVSNGVSVSWPKVPFQLGGWGVSDPGILLTEDDNIFFAGEHLSILQGWQEGAILSAYHAINLIVSKDSNG